MPNSDSEVITLTPVCNPIDQQLMNTIISYLISNDIFILNQNTDTQQDPGQFNIVSYGQAYNFRSVMFELLDMSIPIRLPQQNLKLRNTTINSLGDYYGATWTTESAINYTIIAPNILLKGQPILDVTVLPDTETEYLLTADGNGIVNRVSQSNVDTRPPTLQQVCDRGNATTTTISQADAVGNSDLVTYGQMVNHLADIISTTPEILQLIEELIIAVSENDPSVQAILDQLATKIPYSEKGIQSGVQTLDLNARLTAAQWPLMTLQNICTNGSVTTTTITAQPATTNNHLVTLGQVTALLSSNIGNLSQVLSEGNESNLSIILTDNDLNTITHSYYSSIYELVEDTQTDRLSLYADRIDWYFNEGAVTSNAWIKISKLAPFDRLVIGNDSSEEYIITVQDFGHNPSSGISIDADKLDGYHATEFVLQSDFPVDVSGQTVNNVLVFDGNSWIPGTVSGGSASLTYFAESLTTSGSTNFSTWQPQDVSHNVFLKVALLKNVILGTTVGSLISGAGNFIYNNAATAPTVNGNYNVLFETASGTISGSNNYIFGATANISAQSSYNFVVDTASTLGTSLGATNNIIIKNSTNISSTYTFAGGNNTMLQNTNTKYSVTSISDSFLANNTTLTISNNNIVAIRTYESTISGLYSTVINGYQCTVGGNRAFVSGQSIVTASFANTAFGVYGTTETNVNSTTQVHPSDRQFFVGAGTISVPFNAITIWKSGETQIGGALQLGYSDGTNNETGQPITGMIRHNAGYLEIYRGGWTNVLSTQSSGGSSSSESAYSIIHYDVVSDTPSTYSITGSSDAVTNDYKIRPGSAQSSTNDAVIIDANGLMTFQYTGLFNINVNLRLTISDVTLADRIEITAAINGDITNPVYIVTKNLYEDPSDVSIQFSFTEKFAQTDTLQLFIHYKTGSATHDVTPNVKGTSVTIFSVGGSGVGSAEVNTFLVDYVIEVGQINTFSGSGFAPPITNEPKIIQAFDSDNQALDLVFTYTLNGGYYDISAYIAESITDFKINVIC